jgi:hypothetical protein
MVNGVVVELLVAPGAIALNSFMLIWLIDEEQEQDTAGGCNPLTPHRARQPGSSPAVITRR